MGDITKKHRVIGIRHTLKKFKEAGLVEEDSMYADDAVGNVQDEMLKVAKRWYKVGAKRGAREVLEALLDGCLEIVDTDGKLEVLAHVTKLEWAIPLKVSVGSEKQIVQKKAYALTLRDMEFDEQ
jgi:hypothetical protein